MRVKVSHFTGFVDRSQEVQVDLISTYYTRMYELRILVTLELD